MTIETYEEWLARIQVMIIQKAAVSYSSQPVGLDDFNEFVKDRDYIPVKERDAIESIYLESIDEISDIGRTLARRIQKQAQLRPISPGPSKT